MNKSTLIGVYNKLYKFYGPQRWWPADDRLEIIMGAILTQNTAWRNVEKAIANLKRAHLLSSPRAIEALDRRRLSRLIKPAGYFNIKAKRLKNFIHYLAAKCGSSLRRLSRYRTDILRKDLLAVNGIGHETCDSILLYAFNRPVFVVDAYTKRMFSRHSLFAPDAGYEDVQGLFMRNLPTEARLFNEFHALIVRLAKDYCKAVPDCPNCPLRRMKISCK